ncbi:ankyrin repeat domain-containing protein [Candidatus Berkiella aquae]|uniref:Ankyrin repeat domain-containing protein n=1 Tax=Candidatus Berkiella aquae TaxID=295108 RepID=A0A0Q9YLP3_9GAMM|nr:ankyrin repeat domain-containing protein [Candidatus Berkiella aquae]MCS5711559.1 ankyrin repeat domain-containing protein [Candidatus Berkiella aquae]
MMNSVSSCQNAITTFKQQFPNIKSVETKRSMINQLSKQTSFTVPTDTYGNTLVHFITLNGYLADIDYMLSILRPGEIDCPNNYQITPLIQATVAGLQNVVSLLLAHGANWQLRDYNGKNALEYNMNNRKQVTFKAWNHLPTLPLIEKRLFDLTKIKSGKGISDFLVWLHSINYLLTTPINHHDDPIFHYVIFNCSLAGIKSLLPYLTPEVLAVSNRKGTTILHSLIKTKHYVKANLLRRAGARLDIPDSDGFTPLNYLPLNKSLLTMTSVEQYLEMNQLVEEVLYETLDINHLLAKAMQYGLGIDDPIDENDGTLLHRFIEFIPVPLFQEILGKYPHCDLKVRTSDGVSLIKLAAVRERYAIIELLQKYGVPLYTSELTTSESEGYKTYLQRSYAPVIYPCLAFSFNQLRLKSKDLNEHLLKFFQTYIGYVRSNRFKYHGDRLYSGMILDSRLGESLTLNCYDLATNLGYFLKMQGIDNVRLHTYTNFNSRPFNDKGPLKGDFVCFDQDYQTKISPIYDRYRYERHYVLQVGSRFFDPTFCCYYDNQDDILELSQIKTSLSFAKDRRSYFNLRFLAALHSLFCTEHWTYWHKWRSIKITNKNKAALYLEEKEKHVTLQATNLPKEEVSRVIQEILKTNGIISIEEYKVAVYANRANELQFILKQLEQQNPTSNTCNHMPK